MKLTNEQKLLGIFVYSLIILLFFLMIYQLTKPSELISTKECEKYNLRGTIDKDYCLGGSQPSHLYMINDSGLYENLEIGMTKVGELKR